MVMKFEPFKGREIVSDVRVRVYRNLNRKGVVWSVKQKGKVVGHATALLLFDCECFVNHKIQKRVRKNKVREVHAYVKGFVVTKKIKTPYKVIYNPYTTDRFMGEEQDGRQNQITWSQHVRFNKKGAWSCGYFR